MPETWRLVCADGAEPDGTVHRRAEYHKQAWAEDELQRVATLPEAQACGPHRIKPVNESWRIVCADGRLAAHFSHAQGVTRMEAENGLFIVDTSGACDKTPHRTELEPTDA